METRRLVLVVNLTIELGQVQLEDGKEWSRGWLQLPFRKRKVAQDLRYLLPSLFRCTSIGLPKRKIERMIGRRPVEIQCITQSRRL